MFWGIKKAYYRVYQGVLRVVVNFLDWRQPELLEGAGAIKRLPALIKSKNVKNVLVVTDKGLMSLHLLDSLFAAMEEQGIEYHVYDGVQPNPTIQNIEDAFAMYREHRCEGVVAFGGGSSMDCAKIAAARVVRPNKPVPKMRGLLKIIKKLPPFFAVPTTAGTGSETTLAAVISNPETHEKYPINDPVLIPRYAVLDPELTVGLPKHITSTTGMDALTHAVEAYIGGSNTKDTFDKAEKAVKMIFENLPKAYENGKDVEARGQMLLASYYAGVAFTRAYVGYAHAIAHNLGGLYGVAHGLANAIILPYVLEYYGASAHKRLARLAELSGAATPEMETDAQKAAAFIEAIKAMNKRMEIPDKFDCIQEADIPTLVKRALKEGNPLYPVPRLMDEADCEAVIRAMMA